MLLELRVVLLRVVYDDGPVPGVCDGRDGGAAAPFIFGNRPVDPLQYNIENTTILIPKGNSYCRRKSSARGPWFKVSSE